MSALSKLSKKDPLHNGRMGQRRDDDVIERWRTSTRLPLILDALLGSEEDPAVRQLIDAFGGQSCIPPRQAQYDGRVGVSFIIEDTKDNPDSGTGPGFATAMAAAKAFVPGDCNGIDQRTAS